MTTPTDRDKETARPLARYAIDTAQQAWPETNGPLLALVTDAIATALAAERARIVSDLAGGGFNDAADFLNGDKQ